MNRTILLVKLLGINPPYTVDSKLLNTLDKMKIYQLYLHAKLNKLEYLFLKSLEYAGVIERYSFLKNRLLLCENTFSKFIESVLDVRDTLLETGAKHVFIKTIYDIPILPGDIDVLIGERIFTHVISSLIDNGFIPFDRGPHFISVYNTNVDPNIPREKKPYDVDIYDEISLNYLVYLDKSQFMHEIKSKHMKVCTNSIHNNVSIPVLSDEYELIININHSLFEQLFTLLHFYVTLLLIRRIEPSKLVEVVNRTRSFEIMKHSIRIVLSILKNAFDNEDYLLDLSKIVDTARIMRLKLGRLEHAPELPYRFKLRQIASAIREKILMRKFAGGLTLLVANVFNPRMCNHIMYHIVLRRKRITY